jgi:hypothetical protein
MNIESKSFCLLNSNQKIGNKFDYELRSLKQEICFFDQHVKHPFGCKVSIYYIVNGMIINKFSVMEAKRILKLTLL